MVQKQYFDSEMECKFFMKISPFKLKQNQIWFTELLVFFLVIFTFTNKNGKIENAIWLHWG